MSHFCENGKGIAVKRAFLHFPPKHDTLEACREQFGWLFAFLDAQPLGMILK